MYAQQLFAIGDVAVLECAPVLADYFDELSETEARSELPLRFALWQQADKQLLEASQFGRTAQVDVLSMRGDAALLLPGAGVLASNDLIGCVLDRKTSYALFGSFDAVGETLEYQKKTYTVRGILDVPYPTLLIPVKRGNQQTLSKLSLDVRGIDAKNAADAFALRHELQISAPVYSRMCAQFADSFSQLPAWVLMIGLLFGFRRFAQNCKNFPVRYALRLTLSVLFLIAFFWICKLHISFPNMLVPTRWSDFDFWSRTISNLQDAVFCLLRSKKNQPELLYLAFLAKSIAASLGAGILTACLICTPYKDNYTRLFATIAGCILLTFGAVMLVSCMGFALTSPRMIWLAFPLYFTGRHIMQSAEHQNSRMG